jgi:hypothetical protein
MALSITTLRIITFGITTLSITTFSIIPLSIMPITFVSFNNKDKELFIEYQVSFVVGKTPMFLLK